MRILGALFAVVVAASSAFAHFPFIVVDPNGATARLVMSETLEPDGEVPIDILKDVTLTIRSDDGRDTPLTLSKGEQWMSMALPGDGPRTVHGIADLGYMQRGNGRPHRLVYYPKTIIGDAFAPTSTLGASVPVELIPVAVEDGFELRLLIAGKPAASQEVRVIDPAGQENDYQTDANGLIGPFTDPGRYGAWARHWVDETGTLDGKTYDQVRLYATLVFDSGHGSATIPAEAEAASAEANVNLIEARVVAKLPYPAASFGAAASDGWLYFFGGHTARRHEYSTASVSKKFYRMSLTAPGGEWQELPSGDVAVQGMNLAVHNGRIIRAGGMEPRNPPGQKADSYSIDACTVFDPAAKAWGSLPALPYPRSSHDIAVVGDKVFVIGGWWMKGGETDPEFFETMEVLDLSAQAPAWTSVPQPFSRRAMIVAVLDDKIFAIGGFDAEDVPHLEVDVYDTRAKTWSKGPAIPGRDRDGFAPAACTIDGTIYLSVGSGRLFRLSEDQQSWTLVAKTTPRLAHRMVAHGKEVIIVGGASEARMVDDIEAVQVVD